MRKRDASSIRYLTSIFDPFPRPILLVNEIGKILYANPASLEAFGAPVGEAREVFAAESAGLVSSWIHRGLNRESTQCKARIRHRNGMEAEALVSVFPAVYEDEVLGVFFLIQESVSPQERPGTMDSQYGLPVAFKCNAEFLAYHDELANLPNRRLLEQYLQQKILQAQEQGKSFSLMYVDVNQFRSINHMFDLQVGDRLIQQIAERLKGCFPDQTFIARIIGDEFVIVLDEDHPESLKSWAERVLMQFNGPFLVDHYELSITVSIGICLFPEAGEDVESLIRNGQLALSRAKEKAKNTNTYEVFSSTIDPESYKAFVLRNDLAKALEQKELILYYQPRIESKSNEIVAAEALLRWFHPQWGMISPAQFISLAEETGIIAEIGTWVLRQACLDCKRWHEAGLPPIRVSVNFSARQFLRSDVVQTIQEVLEETNLEGEWLEIEITESTFMENRDHVEKTVERIKELGIRIAIDDFGTGYSSLSYLSQFYPNTIKIDKSFIDEMTTNAVSKEIVSTITALGNKLNITIVAEGVETLEQLSFLKQVQCKEIQGYIYSKPLPKAEFEKILFLGRCVPSLW